MRILHIISSVDPRGGGPVEGIRQRGLHLQAQGHTIEVLSMDAPTEPFVQAYPLKVHAVGPSRGGVFAYTPSIVPWLMSHVASYDAVVISGLWQYHGQATSQVMRRLGLPYHIFTHGMLDPWFRHTYPLKHAKKWLYWHLAEFHVLKHAKAVLFTSEEERLRARDSFARYQANERVVDYGTSAPPSNATGYADAFHATHPELTGKHLLLFLSRIHEKKGCDLLIDAFAQMAAQHPNIHLVMAGPAAPTIQAALTAQAQHLRVADRITWLGMVSGDAKWQAMYGCNAFVLPSHQENFGIAVVEAMACGLPVLISDKVNIWREVLQDHAGLVASDTKAGTTENLQRWLSMNTAAQIHMSHSARESYQKRFTVAASADSLLKVLGKVPE
jgi:glycosyltransferase involved in cell wall biosynthesis